MPNLTDYIDRMPETVKQDLRLTLGLSGMEGRTEVPIKQLFRSSGVMGKLGAAANPAILGAFAYQDYKQGGIGQAATGLGTNLAFEFGMRSLMRSGGHVAGAGFRSAMTGLARGGIGLAANPYVLAGAAVVGTAAVMAGTMYAGASASWQYHLNQLPLETTGSMSAFQTSSAATMRQRSVMNIQRSHLNARSAFGNEAEWAHIARYRGIGRRGTR